MGAQSLEQDLRHRLAEVDAAGLRRAIHRVDAVQSARLVMSGRSLLNFASNDYLGLAGHPVVREAASVAAARYGAGSTASRLICGSLAPHHELEAELADFKRCEAALSFASGYAAAVGTVPALVGPGDVVVLDKRVHACLVDAARLSRATLRVFHHNDPDSLGDILKWADRRGSVERPRVLVITESVFSMDGDRAPLSELVALKERYGAWLMVDEAHATGLHGPDGRGLVEEQGLSGRVEVQMSTLGKALGAAGGCILGSRTLVDWLLNKARSFIFSTAPVPAAAAAALASIRLVRGAEGGRRRMRLWQRVGELRLAIRALAPGVEQTRSAILPVVLGGERRALAVSGGLRERGLLVPAIRYPTVARGSARLRLTVSAAHAAEDVAQLADALTEALAAVPEG